MKSIFSLLLISTFWISSSVYDKSVHRADGETLDLHRFENKKILFVNIATTGERVKQLGELQQLWEHYRDSLVIIAFPSNSFGNESRTSAEVADYCRSIYGASYVFTEKCNITGEGMHPLYQWLTREEENDVLDSEVHGDFQKYLVGKNGELMGIFAPDVSVFNPSFIQALNQ
jgi:glutathione peroxidase